MNDNLQNLTLTAKEFETQRKAFAMAVLIAVAVLLFLRREELDQLRLSEIARMAVDRPGGGDAAVLGLL